MGRKEKRKAQKLAKKNPKLVENDQVKNIEKLDNRLTDEDNQAIEQAKQVIDIQVEEHYQNVDRYCKAVEMSTKKLLQEMSGGMMWLDDEKKAMAYIQQLAGIANELIKTQPEKHQVAQNLRQLIHIFSTNALLRTEHDFFKKMGY